MTFRKNVQIDSSRASSGGGGGRRVAVGGIGGVGGLLLIGLYLLMGGNPGNLGSMLSENQDAITQNQGQSASKLEHCKTGEDANTYADCRVIATAQSVDQMWQEQLPAQAGLDYSLPGITVFTDATQSGCGYATAATGPFYCPADSGAYFDVSFFDQLTKFGATNTAFAQEYIVAHEIGHHIQKLEGTLHLANYNNPGAESDAVKVELQADCYAGMWAHYADKGPNPFLEPITEQQVMDAVTAAQAVGDDNIQKRSGGTVRPDLFTHGSSEQRAQAFLTGYQNGTMSSCDYLERGVYNG